MLLCGSAVEATGGVDAIEQAVAKLKAHLRQATERIIDGLSNAIDLYSPQECANFSQPVATMQTDGNRSSVRRTRQSFTRP